MELATNSFTKGLQIDTNPMMTGNDVMTDCLNGTLITMSGNEVVLLNDMGNRKVNDAYLPSGYTPVGMKEYGGIIYVAAYNPITNRSLIGSFPSPQLNMKDDQKDLSGEFDFYSGFTGKNDDTLNIYFLENPEVVLKLTKDVNIKPGDKFVVYTSCNDSVSDIISNYNNISYIEDTVEGKKVEKPEGYVYSPKNKKYTLSLGILNSQNEFVDITNTLKRYYTEEKGNDKINDIIQESTITLENPSEKYRFNRGYFITTSNPNYKDGLLRLNPANSYSYKLVGPLALKIKANQISRFSYSIHADVNDGDRDKYKAIYIDVDVYYNCPDSFTNTKLGNSPKNYGYKTFEIADNGKDIPESSPICIYFRYKKDNKYQSLTETTESRKLKSMEYDPETDLYHINYLYTIKLEDYKSFGVTDNKLEYWVGFKSGISTYYNKDLQAFGSLDLSLQGSGVIKVKGYRYLNDFDNNSGVITLDIEAYPEYGKSFSNFELEFYELKDGGESGTERSVIHDETYQYKYEYKIDDIQTGIYNIPIKWDNLTKRKFYLLSIMVDYLGESKEEKYLKNLDGININAFSYMTTNLFNNRYYYYLDLYASNFSSQEVLNNIYVKPFLTYNVNRISRKGQLLKPNCIVRTSEGDIEFEYSQTTKCYYNIDLSIEFDKNLYPDFLDDLNLNNYISSRSGANCIFNNVYAWEEITNPDDGTKTKLIKYYNKYTNYLGYVYPAGIVRQIGNNYNDLDFIWIYLDRHKYSNNNSHLYLELDVSCKDKYKSTSIRDSNITITNAFDIWEHAVEKILEGNKPNGKFNNGGIFLAKDGIRFISGLLESGKKYTENDGILLREYSSFTESEKLNGVRIYDYEMWNKICSSFAENIPESETFTWIINTEEELSVGSNTYLNHGVIWLRNYNGDWHPIGITDYTSYENVIKLLLKNLATFCLYKKTTSSNLYFPDPENEGYNLKYDSDYRFDLNIGLDALSSMTYHNYSSDIVKRSSNKGIYFHFTLDETLLLNIPLEIHLESSDEFLEWVNDKTYDRIDLNTGIILDDINKIYTYDSLRGLVADELYNKYYKVDFNHGPDDDTNTLLIKHVLGVNCKSTFDNDGVTYKVAFF